MKYVLNTRSALLSASLILQSFTFVKATGWASMGCFSDPPTSQALQAASFLNSPNFTLTQCTSFCDPYLYLGIEDGQDCYCDNVIHNNVPIDISNCNVHCTGETDTYCGGLNAIQIFYKVIPPPIVWNSLGCYTDSTTSRTIRTASYTSVNNMTIASCQAYCATGGYLFAGVEYARECYCDNTIHSPGAPAPITPGDPTGGCNMPCTGDQTELCGGSDRIQIFERGN